MDRPDRVWFPAKTDCKWLWDLPNCWQGWVVVVAWWLTLIAGIVCLSNMANAAILMPVFVVVWSALLAGICYVKGERLGIWR